MKGLGKQRNRVQLAVEDQTMDFSSESGLIAWIDLLGVRRLTLPQMEELIRGISQTASIATGKVGNRKLSFSHFANTSLIGDAICVSENKIGGPAGVLQVAINISAVLFQRDRPHRGFILRGSFAFRHSGLFHAYVTGPGVVEAMEAEQSMKLCGLGIDAKLSEEVGRLTIFDGKDPIIVSESIKPEKRWALITSRGHQKRWKTFCDTHAAEHPYIAAGKFWADQCG